MVGMERESQSWHLVLEWTDRDWMPGAQTGIGSQQHTAGLEQPQEAPVCPREALSTTNPLENRKMGKYPKFLTIDNHEGVGVRGERSDPSPIPGWALLPLGLGRTGRDPEWGQVGFSPAGMGEGSLPRSSRWERRRRSRTPRARPRTAPPGSGNSCCPPVRGRGAWSGTEPPAPRSFPDLSWVFPDF